MSRAYCLCGSATPLGSSLRCTLCGASYEGSEGWVRARPRGVMSTSAALDLLLLRTWGLFNRTQQFLPADVERDTIAALRTAHAALDAEAGIASTFPHDRFPETTAGATA